MEKLYIHRQEREIIPPDLFRHYVDARKKAFATGGDQLYILDDALPGFKVFRWKNPELPYHFEDHYTDTLKGSGNFAGFEINRKNSRKGERLTFYDYSGGLTEEGMKLGEDAVYSRLRKFLGECTELVRIGRTGRFNFKDELGKWVYEGKATVEAYGWHDDELISRNGILVYKLRGNGICFIHGF